MLYNVVVNDWGETTYVPTALGNALLVLLIAALLAGAVIFAARRQKTSRLSIGQLAFCAMSIALGTVLSNIKILDFPWGGSATLLSMLVICLPGWCFGLGAGLMTSTAYGILQLLLGPYVLYPLQLVVDYLLAFGALGLSGFFVNAKNGLIKGYITGVLGRYVFTTLSGWLFFGMYAWEGWNALPYSMVYNGIYLFAEAAITLVILAIPATRKMLVRIRSMVLRE